jgi:two-component system chemotaxis response regulator CheY
MRIVIADDSATMRRITRGLLQQFQVVNCAEAADGQQVLRLLEEGPWDLVLLDLHMPVMDGLQCLAALRARPKTADVPVIILSSDSGAAEVERAYQLGARAFLNKPVRAAALWEAIRSAVPADILPVLPAPAPASLPRR